MRYPHTLLRIALTGIVLSFLSTAPLAFAQNVRRFQQEVTRTDSTFLGQNPRSPRVVVQLGGGFFREAPGQPGPPADRLRQGQFRGFNLAGANNSLPAEIYGWNSYPGNGGIAPAASFLNNTPGAVRGLVDTPPGFPSVFSFFGGHPNQNQIIPVPSQNGQRYNPLSGQIEQVPIGTPVLFQPALNNAQAQQLLNAISQGPQNQGLRVIDNNGANSGLQRGGELHQAVFDQLMRLDPQTMQAFNLQQSDLRRPTSTQPPGQADPDLAGRASNRIVDAARQGGEGFNKFADWLVAKSGNGPGQLGVAGLQPDDLARIQNNPRNIRPTSENPGIPPGFYPFNVPQVIDSDGNRAVARANGQIERYGPAQQIPNAIDPLNPFGFSPGQLSAGDLALLNANRNSSGLPSANGVPPQPGISGFPQLQAPVAGQPQQQAPAAANQGQGQQGLGQLLDALRQAMQGRQGGGGQPPPAPPPQRAQEPPPALAPPQTESPPSTTEAAAGEEAAEPLSDLTGTVGDVVRRFLQIEALVNLITSLLIGGETSSPAPSS